MDQITEPVSGVVSEIPVEAPVEASSRKKETIEIVMSRLKRTSSKSYESEISRSTKTVFTRVKYVIKTGIEPVDTLTGGIPVGRTTEIYGLEGCLKTALMVQICGCAQQGEIYEVTQTPQGMTYKKIEDPIEVTVLYIDNETSLEDNQRLIVRGKKVDMIQSDADTIDMIYKQVEETVDCLEEVEAQSEAEHKKSQEEYKKSVAANKKDKSVPIKPVKPLVKQFLVVVVDTIAATATIQEMTAVWGKQDFPRAAQAIKAGFKKLVRRMNDRNVAFIVGNQVGTSFAQKSRNAGKFLLPQEADFETSGGRVVKYFASMRIFMVNANPNYKVFQSSKFPDGQVTQLYTTKNRLVKPRRTARMALLYRTGLSNEYSILEHLAHFKLCTWKDTGAISFNFKKYGISLPPSIEDDDASDGEVEIPHKQHWPKIYAKYKPAFDELYEKSRKIMFETDSLDYEGLAEDEDEDGIGDALSND